MSGVFKGLDKFIRKLEKAADGGLKKEFSLWLEAMGMEFLDIVQGEIIQTQTVDTRRLLTSFDRGDSDNVWKITNGGLTLEVGTNVQYAPYINDGFWTVTEKSASRRMKDGTLVRWVPGRWAEEGGRTYFEYDPDADTGMLLKEKWVDGTGYWDRALAIFERIFDRSLERRLQQWLNSL